MSQCATDEKRGEIPLIGAVSVNFCFFFQAEDGIRDVAVTGVQTCALPISVAATTEEAGQAEQVAEVVPSTVVVDLVDTEVAFEQRGHKYERRNKALPEPKPEACNHVEIGRAHV